MGAALDFRNSIGGEKKITEYMHMLAINGGQLMANEFGTELLFEEDFSRFAAMVDVRLPTTDTTIDFTSALLSLTPKSTYVPVYGLNGKLYARVSAQIYNNLDDFRFLAKAILDIIKNHK